LCVEAGTEKETFRFSANFGWNAAAGANRVTIYALLDGEAATGAFRFDPHSRSGERARRSGDPVSAPRGVKFGLAPLTSMFLTGENDNRIRDNFARNT